METVIKKLLAVVEHLAYSHTFRSEAAGNEVRTLLAEARAALVAAPSSPSSAEGAPASEAPAEAGTDAG